MTWQRRPTHCPSSGSGLQAQSQSSDDGEGHHRRSQLWRPGRRLPTNPGCFLTAKPSAPEEALAGQLDWPRLHSCYRKESPWRLHPAKQSPRCLSLCGGQSRPSSPSLVRKESGARATGQEQRGPRRKRASSRPPLGASGGSGGRRVPGTSQRGGGRGGAPSPGAGGSPPAAGPGSSLVRGLGVLLSCLRPQDPQRPRGCSPPRGARAKLELVRPPARHRDHTGAAGGHR